MTFAAQLTSATNQAADALNKSWRAAVVQAFRLVIQVTPRRDGYAQGGWILINGDGGVGNSPERVTPDFAQLQRVPDIGGVVTLYNNVPYIERLENGWSQQAPEGMLSTVNNRWPALVRANEVRFT